VQYGLEQTQSHELHARILYSNSIGANSTIYVSKSAAVSTIKTISSSPWHRPVLTVPYPTWLKLKCTRHEHSTSNVAKVCSYFAAKKRTHDGHITTCTCQSMLQHVLVAKVGPKLAWFTAYLNREQTGCNVPLQLTQNPYAVNKTVLHRH